MWHKPHNPKDETCHHVFKSVFIARVIFLCVCLPVYMALSHTFKMLCFYRKVHLSHFHRLNRACFKKQGTLQSAQKSQSLIERVGWDSCRHTHQYEFDSVVLMCGWMKINTGWLTVSSESSLYFRHCLHLFSKQHWYVNIFLECLETAS